MWGEMKTFSVVRNPYEKIVSSYTYRRSILERGNPSPSVFHAKTMDFPEWLLAADMYGYSAKEFGDQAWFVMDKEMKEVIVDRVIPLPDLNRRWADIVKWIGLPSTTKLRQINKSMKLHPWQDYHTEETVRWVEERFSKDLELWPDLCERPF